MQAPIMYANGTQLNKTVEILQYTLLLQSFFGQQTFQIFISQQVHISAMTER
jgi:hypothetical protein